MNYYHESHRWEDVSYHGSPTYQCDFCQCYQYETKASLKQCPNAEECLEKEREKKDLDEFHEYQNLKKQRERWEYLKNKFGDDE